MLKALKPKSEFTSNVATLLTGTTVAQAIPIAITPILTRIYSPEDFGVLALFLAVTTLFGAVANGRYELAIMLPKKDDDAINVAALCLAISTVFSILLLIIASVFNEEIVDTIGNQEIAFWLYLAPLSIWAISFFNVLNYINTRSKNYKDIATTRVFKSLVLAAINLIVGFLKSGAAGLILGQVFSQLFANTKLLKNGLNKFNFRSITKTSMFNQLKAYVDFPKFSMWAVLANNLSSSLLNILISSLFSVKTLGFYAIAQKLLGVPSTIIGNSVSQVFYQQAVNEKNATGRSIKIFRKTIIMLSVISCLVFIPLYFIAPSLFAIILGEEWRVAGEYSKLLLPFYFVRFISSSVSLTVSVFQKNKMSLIINLVILSVSLIVFYLAHYLNWNFEVFLTYFSFSMAALYGSFLLLYWNMVQGKSAGTHAHNSKLKDSE